jgi:hypothetical protein
MSFSAFASAVVTSIALLTALPMSAGAEPQGFGRALIFRMCGDVTRVEAFCTCYRRLHNVPEQLSIDEFKSKVCQGAFVPNDPAKLDPPNFPSMGKPEVIKFLFVTLYGNGIMRPFCPYDKPCDGDALTKWTSERWMGGERPRLISTISVIAAVYGQSECLKAQADPTSTKWVADLKALLSETERVKFDAELLEMATSKGNFGGQERTIIEAGCSIDPWRIYQQLKQ